MLRDAGQLRVMGKTFDVQLNDVLDDLVVSAIAGDRGAIDAVMAIIRPLVVRYCCARLGRAGHSVVSADDVAQEVCAAVLTALPGYRGQGRPFLAFVYGIASHKVSDTYRVPSRRRTDPVADVPDIMEVSPDPEQRALQSELSARLGGLLARLPARQREILVLRIVVGLSAQETADAIGSTPTAVRVAQHRALARLRKCMSRDGEVG